MDMWESVLGCQGNSEASSDCEPAGSPRLHGKRPALRRSSEVIVGWRVWGISTLDPTSARPAAAKTLILVSTFMDSVWHPGSVMTACCGANTLRHGIHAFATSAEAMKYMAQGRKPMRQVFGEVSLWGRVVIHENGYRAQCAYPRRLFVPEWTP
jgi:hypothetical protein